MKLPGLTLIGLLLFCNLSISQNFEPYPERYRRLIQSIGFSPNGEILYFTLPHKEYLEAQHITTTNKTPRLAIYQANKKGENWGTPTLLPFSGKYKDYEPSLSPDGKLMLFNSNRPHFGDTVLSKNGIWFSTLIDNQWSEPQALVNINTEALEQSYPSISKAGHLVYVAETFSEGKSEYTLYETTFEGKSTKGGQKIPFKDIPFGIGDPCISPLGDYLILTIYEEDQWESTCDLYIAFRVKDKWSKPIPLTDLNSAGPDFAAAISPDQQWIFYRQNYHFVKRPFQPILSKCSVKLKQ